MGDFTFIQFCSTDLFPAASLMLLSMENLNNSSRNQLPKRDSTTVSNKGTFVLTRYMVALVVGPRETSCLSLFLLTAFILNVCSGRNPPGTIVTLCCFPGALKQ